MWLLLVVGGVAYVREAGRGIDTTNAVDKAVHDSEQSYRIKPADTTTGPSTSALNDVRKQAGMTPEKFKAAQAAAFTAAAADAAEAETTFECAKIKPQGILVPGRGT